MEQWQRNVIGTDLDKHFGKIETYKKTIENMLKANSPSDIDGVMEKWTFEKGKIEGIKEVLSTLGYEIGYDNKTQTFEVFDLMR